MKKPPCAEWRIWKGPEVEGTRSVGVSTLFIRSLQDFSGATPTVDWSFLKKSGCERVWFCKEFYRSEPTDDQGNFIAWGLVRAIGKHFSEICLEVEPKDYCSIPKDIKASATIYLKVLDVELKKGDFICVGPAFADEAFQIGTGAKVTPEVYLNDVRIK